MGAAVSVDIPHQFMVECHRYELDGLLRERWLFGIQADWLCADDIGQRIALSPSGPLLTLQALRVTGDFADGRGRRVALLTDDGDWVVPRDHEVFVDGSHTRGAILRVPGSLVDKALEDAARAKGRYAGLPHPFLARGDGNCECGMPEAASVHHR